MIVKRLTTYFTLYTFLTSLYDLRVIWGIIYIYIYICKICKVYNINISISISYEEICFTVALQLLYSCFTFL